MPVGRMWVKTVSFWLSILIAGTLSEEYIEGRKGGRKENNEPGTVLGTRNTWSNSCGSVSRPAEEVIPGKLEMAMTSEVPTETMGGQML